MHKYTGLRFARRWRTSTTQTQSHKGGRTQNENEKKIFIFLNVIFSLAITIFKYADYKNALGPVSVSDERHVKTLVSSKYKCDKRESVGREVRSHALPWLLLSFDSRRTKKGDFQKSTTRRRRTSTNVKFIKIHCGRMRNSGMRVFGCVRLCQRFFPCVLVKKYDYIFMAPLRLFNISNNDIFPLICDSHLNDFCLLCPFASGAMVVWPGHPAGIGDSTPCLQYIFEVWSAVQPQRKASGNVYIWNRLPRAVRRAVPLTFILYWTGLRWMGLTLDLIGYYQPRLRRIDSIVVIQVKIVKNWASAIRHMCEQQLWWKRVHWTVGWVSLFVESWCGLIKLFYSKIEKIKKNDKF